MNSQYGHGRSSSKQWLAALAASSIMFNSSFLDIPWLTEPLHRNQGFISLIISVFIVTIGAFLGAIFADIFGRKKTLLGASIFVLARVAGIIVFRENDLWIVRIFTELGSGITCTVVPLYISEIAGVDNRRTLMIMQLLARTMGMWIVSGLQATFIYFQLEVNERIIDGVLLGIAVIFHVIVIAIYPETPHYLNLKKEYQGASQSLAFFRGMSHVKIRGESHELPTMYTPTNRNEPGCCGKFGELFKFANRRSLAIIFSLLVIRWASGQHRNQEMFWDWVVYWEPVYIPSVFFAIFTIQLFSSIFITLTIDLLQRKISILIVILISMIASIVGMAALGGEIVLTNYWIHFGVFMVQDFAHFILIGVTLVYMGEFFPTNVKALGIAAVVSFELLLRNIFILFESAVFNHHFIIEAGKWVSFLSGPVYFFGLIFIMIFFPRINATPSSEIMIETSTGVQTLS